MTPASLRNLVSCGLAALLAVGCHAGKPHVDGPGRPPPSPGAKPTAAELRDALCSYVARCQVVAMDQATCSSAMASRAEGFDTPEALFHAAEVGRALIDAPKARECLTRLANLSCDDGLSPGRAFADCQLAFSGKVPIGGRCEAEGECVRGARCAPPKAGAGCGGVCVALGKSECADARDCVGDRVCVGGRCGEPLAARPAGRPCSAEVGCLPGLACTHGICRAKPDLGQPCTPGVACASPGLTCLPGATAATCQPSRAKDAPCTQPFECGGVLSALVCDVEGSHTCVARPKDGRCMAGQCDPFSAFCDGTGAQPTCRPFLAEGASCESRAQCGTPFGGADCVADPSGKKHCVGSAAVEACL